MPTRVRAEHDGQPACAYTALPQGTALLGAEQGEEYSDMLESMQLG